MPTSEYQSVGDIMLMAINFAPLEWVSCNGQLLPISQYEALYSLIGTTYGGDGQTTFAVPNLNGRVPIHQGQGTGLTPRTVGQSGGSESVVLGTVNMPPHTHNFQGGLMGINAAATQANASGNGIAMINGFTSGGGTVTANSTNTTAPDQKMATDSLGSVQMNMTGNSGSHNNMQPFLVLNYFIATTGNYPQRPS